MRIIDLAFKDIVQILRDWKSALFLVIMPVIFTLFFGFVFNPSTSGANESDPRLPIGLVNLDPGSSISGSLVSLLEKSDVIRPIILGAEDADQISEMVAEGELAAAIQVPDGYGVATRLDRPASLQVIADQNSPAGRTAVTAVETITNRLLGAVESAHISVEAYRDRVGFTDEAARQSYFDEAFQEAVSAWSKPSLTVLTQKATGEATSGDTDMEINGFTQSSAGMIVQFAIFGLITSAMILVLERKTGVLQRLLTTPIKRTEVIGGHILGMFLVVFAQEVILVTLGQFLFGVNYLRQPLAVLLMMVALALWAVSLGLLIGVIAKKEDQVIVLCLISMFVFAAMGGAWFPLEVSGKAFSAIGHLLPSAWAMDGFQNIVQRGLDFNSVLLPAAVVLAYALAFFGLALWRFKFER
ncbi:MAG: ABC transporter permease [Chloroflexi bacterium]|nr:MAG: ABC transporter permease [Chloroflexota bacterium]